MSRLLPYALLIKPTTAKKIEISGKYRAFGHQDSQQSLDKSLGLSGSSSLLNTPPPWATPHHPPRSKAALLFITSWTIRESEEVFATFPIRCCLCSKKIFSNEAGQLWHGHTSESIRPAPNDAPLRCFGEGVRGCLWWTSWQGLQQHVGPLPVSPCYCAARELQGKLFSLQVDGDSHKNEDTHKVLAGYERHPRYPTTKSCSNQLASPRGMWNRREHTTKSSSAKAQLTAVNLFLSPLASPLPFQTQNAYPLLVQQGLALQLFLCKHKGRAKSTCVTLILTPSCSFLKACSIPRSVSANLSTTENSGFSPQLPGQQRHGRRKEA